MVSSPQVAAWDSLGSAVALYGSVAVLGAHRDDETAINAGAAYVLVVTPCPGDLDGDRHVTLADLAQLLGNYGTPSGMSYADGDLDGDADVDLADLAALLANYGLDCE